MQATRTRQWVKIIGIGLLYAGAAGLTVLILLWFWLRFGGISGSYDAISYYLAGRLVLDGQGPALYDLALQHNTAVAIAGPAIAGENRPFVYPPWVAIGCAVIALLPYKIAYIIFILLQGGALVGAARQLRRLVPARLYRPLLIAVVVSPPIPVLLGHPQWSAWALWSLAGALAAAQQGRQAQAGGWLVLGLVKPSLMLPALLWLIVTRQWRALGVFLAGGAGLSLGSALLCGVWWPSWLRALQEQDQTAADQQAMPTLRGLLTLIGGDLGLWATSLVGVALVGLLLWKAPTAARPLIALLAGWLLIPHAYIHDLIALAAPLAVIYVRYTGSRPLLRLIAPLAWLGGLVPQALLALPICALIALLVRARPEPGSDLPATTASARPAAPPGSAVPG